MESYAEKPAPDRFVITGTGDPIEKENLMEFRLLFADRLPSSGNPREKHAIRRSFHPQLRRLWNLNNNLRQLAIHAFNRDRKETSEPFPTDDERFREELVVIGKNWHRAGFNLVPLVTRQHALRCSLEITLLRPEEDRFIFRRGDIDGQLKTLFDALRIPDTVEETGKAEPQEDENPLFCLLEDDRLITEVKVASDQLLLLPDHREVNATDVHAVIHVRLNHRNARTFDNYFG